MAHGLTIYNENGRLILDNNPYYAMEAFEYGTLANGAYIPILTDGSFMFVRNTVIGQSVSTDENINSTQYYGSGNVRVKVTLGTIAYVKCRIYNTLNPNTGYGLKILDNTGTPKLVFSDAVKHCRIHSSDRLALAGAVNYTLPASLTGQHKYININALNPTKWSGYTAYYPSFTINDTSETSLTLNIIGRTAMGNLTRSKYQNYTIIEA